MPLCVDVATGETVLRRTDLRLPGYIPLTLGRTYRSGRDQSGPFGYGWRLNWELTLEVTSEKITYAPGTPHEVTLSPIEEGMEARHSTGLLAWHRPESYVLRPSPSRRLVFEKEKAWGDTLPLSRIEDPSDNTVHFFYDRERIAGIVDSVGRQIRCKYQGGQVTLLQVIGDNDAASTIRTFRYSRQGDLVEETDAEGHAATFGYSQHLMTEYTRRGGGTQHAGYNGKGQCQAMRYTDGSEERRFTYDESRPSTLVTRGNGRQTLYWHVDSDRVLKRVGPSNGNRNYFYNEMHRLTGFSDEQDVVQTLQQKDTFLEAGKRVAFFELDENRRVTSVLDGLENQYRLSYGAQGRPTELQTPSSSWAFRRDDRGSITEVTSPSGRSVRLRRPSEERKLIIEGEEGGRIEDHFDERGRLVERTDSLQRRFQWRYDGNDRLRSVHAGGQSFEFEYSPEGQPTRIVDAQGRTTTMTYDPFGRLKKYAVDDRQYQLTYDSAGRVAALQDPGMRETRLEYKKSDQLAKIHYASGRTSTYHYTEDGIKVLSEQDGQSGMVLYNPAGNPVQWDRPGEQEHFLEYGPSGELMIVERGDRVLNLSYDEDGRVVEATEDGQTLKLEYDVDGHLETASIGGESVFRFSRDARGRPVEMESKLRSFQLAFDAGDRLQVIEGDGRRWEIDYDAFNHLTEFSDGRPSGKETPQSILSNVHTHDLNIPKSESRESEPADLQLHAARHGAALSLRIGSWCLPLWRQEDYPSSGRLPSSSLIATMLAFGKEPLITRLEPTFPPYSPQRWTRLARHGVRSDYTEIPQPEELNCFETSPLSHFFLARSFFEMSDLSLLPEEHGAGKLRRGSSTDPLVTGPHDANTLRPSIWTHRAAGPRFGRKLPGLREGSVCAIDLLELVCHGNHTIDS